MDMRTTTEPSGIEVSKPIAALLSSRKQKLEMGNKKLRI